MKKRTFKLLLSLLLLIAVLAIIVFLLINLFKNKFPYKFEKEVASINELYILGNHLNFKGDLNLDDDINKLEFVLFDENEMTYELKYNKEKNNIKFYFSSEKNRGLLLDSLKSGNYISLLKITNNDNSIKYYKLDNKTDYNKTEYYSLRKNDKFNYILINMNKKETLNIKVEPSSKKEIYDVVIDAGHGGIDTGACYKGTCETDYTLKLSQKLKDKLEEKGLKVKLTRDDSVKNNQRFETYGKNGRIDRAMSSKAKYLFSFHLNSGLSTRTGTEIYTTNNIDYTLAHSIVDSIVKNTNTDYSNNNIFKVDKGIYTRTFQKYEINDTIKDAKDNGYEPYNISTNTTYYYIIRETGGFMTGAYVDGRDDELNTYYNTNVGLESYIMELGYVTNPKDTDDIKNNMDKYIEAISKAIIENICE